MGQKDIFAFLLNYFFFCFYKFVHIIEKFSLRGTNQAIFGITRNILSKNGPILSHPVAVSGSKVKKILDLSRVEVKDCQRDFKNGQKTELTKPMSTNHLELTDKPKQLLRKDIGTAITKSIERSFNIIHYSSLVRTELRNIQAVPPKILHPLIPHLEFTPPYDSPP